MIQLLNNIAPPSLQAAYFASIQNAQEHIVLLDYSTFQPMIVSAGLTNYLGFSKNTAADQFAKCIDEVEWSIFESDIRSDKKKSTFSLKVDHIYYNFNINTAQPVDTGEKIVLVLTLEHRQTALQKDLSSYLIPNLDKFLTAMQLGLMVVDTEEKILLVDNLFCSIVGYTQDELVGKVASKVFLHAGLDEFIEEQTKNRTKGKSDVYELPILKKDKSKIWLRVTGMPLYDVAGKMIGSIGVHEDITLMKTAEESLMSLRKSEVIQKRMNDKLIDRMNSKIQSSLSELLLVKSMLKMPETIQFAEKRLDDISNQMTSVLGYTNDFYKILNEVAEEEKTVFNMGGLPFKLKEIYSKRISDKKLDFRYYSDIPASLFVKGEEFRMFKALQNLLETAIDHTEKGFIGFYAEFVKDTGTAIQLRFKIEDSGSGISKEQVASLQHKTFNLEQFSKVFQGVGFGIALSRRIFDLLGGRMSIKSVEGFGTQCSIELELEKLEKKGSQVILKPNTFQDFAGLKVLLVEDNMMCALMTNNLLRNKGIEVDGAENGLAALKMVRENYYDLILMDIQMPVMNGFEAVSIIRTDLQLKIPIIALTAADSVQDHEKCKLVGFSDFLNKPFDSADLFDKICTLLPKQVKNH